MIGRSFIAGLFGLLTTLPAVAAPVTFTFEGLLSFVSPALSSAFNIGDSFAGSFTFENVTADIEPTSPTIGDYAPDISFSMSIGTRSFSSPSSTGRILILNASQDVYSANGLTSGNVVSGFAPNGWEFVLIDFDGTLLNSDVLPLTPPPLSLAEISDLELFFVDTNGNSASIVGNLTSFALPTAPVPEPGTYALILAGLGIVSFVASRRKA